MPYQLKPVTLELSTDVTHSCYIHQTRDQHLIGIIEFSKPTYSLKWEDLEYFRRRTEEFSVIPIPECIHAIIIDIREVSAFLDQETPIIPWRLIEEECLIRIVVPTDRLEFYTGCFEPTWLTSDIESAITEIRSYVDMPAH